jgi:hypothetical protein
MSTSQYVILVHGDRTPVLLGPMSEEMRLQTLRDLRARYQGSGLHTLDITARSTGKVTAKINRYEQKGEQE